MVKQVVEVGADLRFAALTEAEIFDNLRRLDAK
jgi:hypothetical protein